MVDSVASREGGLANVIYIAVTFGDSYIVFYLKLVLFFQAVEISKQLKNDLSMGKIIFSHGQYLF